MTLMLRRTTASDSTAVVEVHRAAFSSDVEADLVQALLTNPSAQPAESWVADVEGAVVAHVLLTPGIVPIDPTLPVMLLCPLAVLPSHQHSRLGTAVTRAALDSAAGAGVRAVTVFGDPEYYSRFGFESLLPRGPLPAFDVAPAHESAWQTLVLNDDPSTRSTLEGARITWAEPLMTPALWQS